MYAALRVASHLDYQLVIFAITMINVKHPDTNKRINCIFLQRYDVCITYARTSNATQFKPSIIVYQTVEIMLILQVSFICKIPWWNSYITVLL